MATNPINQPFQPFHVQSKLLNDTPQRGTPGPQGPRMPSGSGPWNPSGDLRAGPYGWLAGLAFIAIYVVSQRYVELMPVTIGVLIACVLLRLGARERQFAVVPVTLAGIRLALQMTGSFSMWATGQTASSQLANAPKLQALGVTWLPLFFSACLFYMPKRISVTAKIILACSLILLVSGLLPGEGYLYLFGVVQCTLFLAIAIELIMDFVPQQGNSAAGSAIHGARP